MVESTANQSAMISVLIQDLAKADKYYHIECEASATVEDLKCLINIESNIAVEQQVLYFKQETLRVDTKRLDEIGINNNDMINLGVSNLSTEDQNLMGAFFSQLNTPKSTGPRMNQQQLLNQMFHNVQNERIRREVQQIRDMFATDAAFKMRLTANDPTLAAALEAGNNQETEKIVSERMKEIFEKQRAEQTRLARLRNADPNDAEA